MPNIEAVLKEEIRRQARRAVRPEYGALKRDNTWLKHQVAALKRAISRLERDNALLVKDANSRLSVPPKVSAVEVRGARLSPRLIASLRKRLGLSQQDFGRLAGVSLGSVAAWEAGRSKPRAKAKATLVGLRKLGRREAKRRLKALAAATLGPSADGGLRKRVRRNRAAARRS